MPRSGVLKKSQILVGGGASIADDLGMKKSQPTYHLINADGVAIPSPVFSCEDAAYDYVAEVFGEDAWNDTVILASDEVIG